MNETTNKKPTLFLIDGNNYVYRAFYAIRNLSNSKGFPTNAIYGFTAMLLKLFRESRPDYIAVIFDSKSVSRSEAYQDYKAHRQPMPDALSPQIPYIKDIIQAFSIPVILMEGLEADDIIGALATRYSKEGFSVTIVSGDKDMMQVVSENVLMLDTMKDKVYGIEQVKEYFGVEPAKVVEILGLMGDTSDNIPGVPGIGEKTARNLIMEFGSIDGVLANIPKIKNARIRESLEKNAPLAKLSRDLATFESGIEVEFDLEAARYKEPDKLRLRDIFKECEFLKLIQELDIREIKSEVELHLVQDMAGLETMAAKLKEAGCFSFSIEPASDAAETGALTAEIAGISFCCDPGESYYLPVNKFMPLEVFEVFGKLASLFGEKQINKVGHDIKSAILMLSRKGIILKGVGCDTMVASYVLNPSKRSHQLVDIARDYLDKDLLPLKDITGSGKSAISFDAAPVEKAMDYSCQRACAIFDLSRILLDSIKEDGFEKLFCGMEMPLTEVLAAMEKRGVLIDLKAMREISQELESLMSISEDRIYGLAGEKFNINSPKQIQYILFEKLNLPKGRKTKNGHSTDADVLANLALNYELPAEILGYRTISKLKTTYVDALPMLVNPATGRIHTSYNQTVTATGRLSSSNPNLQNIPIRTEEGRRIRRAFIAPTGCLIISADYSQIELRILAHLSDDQRLIEIFRKDEDIHNRTAAEIFGVMPELVNGEMRRQAKVINFGILYGMSPFGLSKELGISQPLAKAYIDKYFAEFEGVRTYIDSLVHGARRDGYVTTLFDRRRYIPDINSPNFAVRQFAERTAINTPVQGTAADLIKLAMINIENNLKQGNYSAGLIMQVHDELVFDVPAIEKDAIIKMIRKEMEGVIELKVPLKVDIHSRRNWDEAH
ncbi:MAG: DNA polymerase I [Syntrophaceae bacterium]